MHCKTATETVKIAGKLKRVRLFICAKNVAKMHEQNENENKRRTLFFGLNSRTHIVRNAVGIESVFSGVSSMGLKCRARIAR